jgi:hypothetical protein
MHTSRRADRVTMIALTQLMAPRASRARHRLRVRVDAEVAIGDRRRRPIDRRRDPEVAIGVRRTPDRNASGRGWPSCTVTRGAALSAGNRWAKTRSSASVRPARARSARNTRSAEVRQTTSVGTPAAPSSAAAASTCGITAPIPTRLTRGCWAAPAAGIRRRDRRPASLSPSRIVGDGSEILVDGARGQPKIG